jgi:hypothetical protein
VRDQLPPKLSLAGGATALTPATGAEAAQLERASPAVSLTLVPNVA